MATHYKCHPLWQLTSWHLDQWQALSTIWLAKCICFCSCHSLSDLLLPQGFFKLWNLICTFTPKKCDLYLDTKDLVCPQRKRSIGVRSGGSCWPSMTYPPIRNWSQASGSCSTQLTLAKQSKTQRICAQYFIFRIIWTIVYRKYEP